MYRAGNVTFSLVIQADDPRDGMERWTLDGLITPEEDGAVLGSETRLIARDGRVLTSRVDGLGNLLYESLPPDTYRLELDLPEHTVVIEDLRIGGG